MQAVNIGELITLLYEPYLRVFNGDADKAAVAVAATVEDHLARAAQRRATAASTRRNEEPIEALQ